MKKIVSAALLLAVSGSLFARSFVLNSVQLKENEVNVYQGKTVQTYDDDRYTISIMPTVAEDDIQFAVAITNKTDQTYHFNENAITAYAGNYETDVWQDAGYIPATVYFRRMQQMQRDAEIAGAIDLGLNVLGTGVMIADAFMGGHGRGPSRSYSRPAPPPYPNVSGAVGRGVIGGLAIADSYNRLSNIKYEGQSLLEYFQQNLLFEKDMAPSEEYDGMFIIEKCGRMPDYKVVIQLDPFSVYEFIFSRSDRDIILNPTKDRDYARSSLTFEISPFLNHFGGSYIFSNPTGVGFYTSVDIQGSNNIYGASFTGSSYGAVGFTLGMTVKTWSNTWLLIGMGPQITLKDEDDAAYKEQFFFKPQVGLNFIFDSFNCGVRFAYPIGAVQGTPEFDLSIGLSY